MTKEIVKPRLEDVFFQLKDDIFNTFNCHRVGRIVSFNSSNQTADVQLVDKATEEVFEGNKLVTKIREYPLLSECPVLINYGLSGGFTRPIKEGEYCIIHFNDRDLDNWFENGNIQVPNSKRVHNISDCMVSVGLFSQSSPIPNFDNEATKMQYENTVIRLKDKIKINNQDKDLKILIDQLITVLLNFVSVDNPAAPTITVSPNLATQNSLNQLLTEFNELLE